MSLVSVSVLRVDDGDEASDGVADGCEVDSAAAATAAAADEDASPCIQLSPGGACTSCGATESGCFAWENHTYVRV